MIDEKVINLKDHSQNYLDRARNADRKTFLEAGVLANSVEIKKISYHQVLSRTVKTREKKVNYYLQKNPKIEKQ